MVVKWSEEFRKLHPDVRFDISAGGAGKGIADALADMVDIGMVSREINPAEIQKGAWFIPVTKDAVVPVINQDNPLFKEIMKKGIKKSDFARIWLNEEAADLERTPGRQGQRAGPRLHPFRFLRRGRDLGPVHGEKAGGPAGHRRLRRSRA